MEKKVAPDNFKRGEVVQFALGHKWAGCFGIIEEVKGPRIMVGMPTPPQAGHEGEQWTAYIFVEEKDLLKLMLEMDGEVYGVNNKMTVVSQITTFDPEEV